VSKTVWLQLSESYFRTPPASPQRAAAAPQVEVKGRELPKPSEGQPIPPGQSAWISRPDNCIRDVWTAATEHHFTFCKRGYERRFDAIQRRLGALFAALPSRRGNAELALRLNQASRWYPRLGVWIVLGLFALAWRRPRGGSILAALALAAFVVIVLNALGLFADPRFALPVAPAFVLFGSCALLGRR
jgi:hypothetical protein